MKIVRELETNISFKEVEKIYKSGHKVAIALHKSETVAYLSTTMVEAEDGCVTADFEPGSEIECKPGICVEGEDIKFVGGDQLVVMDGITGGKDCSFELYPFEGYYADVFITFCMYGNESKIADRVVEVEA